MSGFLSNYCRALGILFVKMFSDSKFKGLLGARQEDWEDFEVLLGRRLQQLQTRVDKDGVSEKTYHVGLACELIRACLQQQADNRWLDWLVVVSYLM